MEQDKKENTPDTVRRPASNGTRRQRYSPPQLTDYGNILVVTRSAPEETKDRSKPPA